MNLNHDDFSNIRDFIYDQASLSLKDDKQYLIESRILPILKEEGFEDFSEFVKSLEDKKNVELHEKVINALTTHETSFFRDFYPFESLKKIVIPEFLEKSNSNEITFWCAAASFGQEPYSIAMLMKENFPKVKTRIIATDIAKATLDYAKKGCFSLLEVNRGLPAPLLVKYFRNAGNLWYLNDSIKEMVSFESFNLTDSFESLPQSDIVFMRNVLVYFEDDTKKNILEKVSQAIHPNSSLFMGMSESLAIYGPQFKRVPGEKCSWYRLNED